MKVTVNDVVTALISNTLYRYFIKTGEKCDNTENSEYQKIMAERAAEEKLKKEAKERERISILEKMVEEQIKLQNLSMENGKLEIMMIKEIRKRVYLKADQEERLALIKDDMGALRPSLFANVPT